MGLASGTRLGRYEILGSLGAGGMGEVYRARDTQLGRDVAIKVLPDGLAADRDRVARFAREARLLASLNHRHIATIHGFEESAGTGALVMELVEGPTLDEKLIQDARATPAARLASALAISRQIAEGLEAAHDKGIIHRDLKPANVRLTHDGSVKVLDFGLAKALAVDAADPAAAGLATMTGTGIRVGTIVGTPAYMSPEQARGLAVDRRTDIWAFGCLLYEMLTGRRAFDGATVSDTIAAVLERQPELNALPANTPPAVRRLVRRCLEKDPNRRLHDIADARIELEDAASGAPADAPVAQAPGRSRPAITGALVLLGAVAAGAGVWLLRPAPPAREVRLDIATAPTRDTSVAASPDGLKVAFVVTAAGKPQLWVRSLDSNQARVLAGTENATTPFWSPDSRSIGFVADARLKRVEADGGPVQTLVFGVAVPLGASWGPDGTILFGSAPNEPISRISSSGGAAVPATRVEAPQQRGHFYPQFLPDGRHFLYFVDAPGDEQGTYISELGSTGGRQLPVAKALARYSPTGHLLFVRDGKLLAQPFDAGRGEPMGDPVAIDEHLPAGQVTLSVSAAGPIVYRTSSADNGQRQLAWFDRSGRELDKVVYLGNAAQGPALSRDGRYLAVFKYLNGNMDIWSFDTERRSWERQTFNPGDDIYPLWSPDGKSIIFAGVRKSQGLGLFRRVVAAPPETEELLVTRPPTTGRFPMDWSRDGRFILFAGPDQKGVGLFAAPLDGDRATITVAKNEFNNSLGQFSPDGKWVAYESDRSGSLEVYVRPFPGPGPDTRVSTEGGSQVRWNPVSDEMFYVAPDDYLMAVPVARGVDGAIEPGKPSKLFLTNVGSTATLKYRHQYVVSPDGKSFVMNSVIGEPSVSPISVILNWRGRR